MHTLLSSQEFDQDINGAKKATLSGPVFITDRGKPTHVLLSLQAFERLLGSNPSIIDVLAMPGAEDIEFAPPRAKLSRTPS